MFSTAATALRHLHLGQGEAQMMTFIAFARPRRTAFHQRTGLADSRVEMGDKGFLLAGGVHRNGLPLWTGGFHRFAILVGLNGEIGQVEFFGIRLTSANGGLDVFDLMLLQNDIRLRAAMTAVGVERVQVGARFQVGQGFG